MKVNEKENIQQQLQQLLLLLLLLLHSLNGGRSVRGLQQRRESKTILCLF